MVGPGLRHGAGCSRAAVAWPHFLLCTNSLLETVHRCGQCMFLKSWCVSEAKFLKNLGTQSHASCEPDIGLVAPPCPSPALPGSSSVAPMVLGDPNEAPSACRSRGCSSATPRGTGQGRERTTCWVAVRPSFHPSFRPSFLPSAAATALGKGRAGEEQTLPSPVIWRDAVSGFLFGSVVLC